MSKTSNTTIHKRPKLSDALAPLKPLVKSIHPCCESIPLIGSTDFNNLVESITQYGLQQPIQIDSSKALLDGRSRIMACFVAGVPITEDDIETTDSDPEAIAQSNIARRHLSKDQKIMEAVTRDLARERRLAEIRKQKGADVKRNGRDDQLGTDSVPSKTDKKPTKKKKREPKAIDRTAKLTGISRDKLQRGETLAKKDSALARRVEEGTISLADAEKQAGVAPKNRKKAKRARPKSGKKTKQGIADGSMPEGVLLDDGRSKVFDTPDGVRACLGRNSSCYEHERAAYDILVLAQEGQWWVGTYDGQDFEGHSDRDQAEQHALALITSLTKSEWGSADDYEA